MPLISRSFVFKKTYVRSNLSFFIIIACHDLSRKLGLPSNHEDCFLYFSLKLYDFAFYLRFLTHFNLVCVDGAS